MNRFIFMTVAAGLSLSTQALTLDEALKTAAEISPEIHAARAQTQAATEELRSAALWRNPELEFEAEGIGGDQSGTDAAEYSVMVSQEFPMFGKTARRREVARYAAEAAHFGQLDTQREVETRIRRAFADAQAAEQMVEAHRGQAALSADFLSTVQTRRDTGAASELDLISAEMQAEESRIELENAQRNLDAALRRLARLTSLSKVQKTDGVFFQPLENPVRPERMDAVPQLQIFQTLENQAQAEHALQQRAWLPDVTLGAGAKYEEAGNVQSYVVSASVPLPFWNRGRADTLAAGLRAQAAAATRDRMRRDAEQEIDRLAAELENAQAGVLRCREELLPRAERVVELMQQEGAAGRYSRLEQIEARRRLIELKTRAVDAQRAAWVIYAELLKFTEGDVQ